MNARVFLDTNVLVYAYDSGEPEKQSRAQALLTEGIDREIAVLSAQVLSEFFVVVTQRMRSPLSVDQAEKLIDLFGILPVVEVDRRLVKHAVSACRELHISYWDSLIVCAAERGGCQKILTEDLNNGQIYHGVQVENPFA